MDARARIPSKARAAPVPARASASASASPSASVSPSPAASAAAPAPAPSDALDRVVHAAIARHVGGLSPAALALAWFDWAIHLAVSPGKQLRLQAKAIEKARLLARYASGAFGSDCPDCVKPLPQDRRFEHPGWRQWPFNVMQQAFLMQQQWWHNATTGVRGVSRHHEALVTFVGRQWLDMFSPSNFPATNPEVIEQAVASGGTNFVRGALNLLEDLRDLLRDEPAEAMQSFVPGKDVAVTPGKVVFRNHLIELIRYTPRAAKVHPEPVLIVPSWIMKYYILDLSPANSLVRFLLEAGHDVFMISWRNPDRDDRDLGMDDYRRLGVMEALGAVGRLTQGEPVHAVGYCLGGTLLAIAAAAMAREGDDRLKDITLLAAEVDFRDSGELSLFIDESQLAFLDDVMRNDGYLDGRRMAGAFQLLNSRDLIWSRRVREYLMGERAPLFDLMAWNQDLTRMPYRMHSEYLRRLYLENELAEGRYPVDGRPVVLRDIRVPLFVVGTVRDHVAPWRSVYKIHLLTDAEVTFVLTSGGHNAGVVSEPGRGNRSYQIATRGASDGPYVDPDAWREQVGHRPGSWWIAWQRWLAGRSSAPRAPAPREGEAALGEAPGTYVFLR